MEDEEHGEEATLPDGPEESFFKVKIDGEERDVNFYVKPEAVAMLDDEIHAYFREVGS